MANTNGPVFTRFREDQERERPYPADLLQCCDRTVDQLLTQQTQSNRPGMLLGRIQSGKTKAFLSVVGIAFDNGFDVAVIFTKGNTLPIIQSALRQMRSCQRRNVSRLVALFPTCSGSLRRYHTATFLRICGMFGKCSQANRSTCSASEVRRRSTSPPFSVSTRSIPVVGVIVPLEASSNSPAAGNGWLRS